MISIPGSPAKSTISTIYSTVLPAPAGRSQGGPVAMSVARPPATISIRNYAIVTAAYWAFTLTDGALRMLVLLHFNQLGYTPVQLAFLFLLYEVFGMVTNLVGGWVAARTGLRPTLIVGLALQVIALAGLALLPATAAIPSESSRTQPDQ